MNVLAVAIIAVVVAVLSVLLYKLLWRKAGPNEVLIIGRHRDLRNPELAAKSGLRVVSGRGALVKPGVEAVRRFSLAPREAALAADCLDQTEVPVRIKGVVIFKVGDDYTSIAKAAGRFLDRQEHANAEVEKVVGTQVREIIKTVSVDDVVRDRERLSGIAREASVAAMAEMGLIISSVDIQEIDLWLGQQAPR